MRRRKARFESISGFIDLDPVWSVPFNSADPEKTNHLIVSCYIVGSIQVKIPVSTGEAMLPAEETTLAILEGSPGSAAQVQPLVSRTSTLHRPDRRTG